MVATYIIKQIVHSMICVTLEIINKFLVGQVSGLVKNCSIGIYSNTVNVINVKLCMMALLIELYLLIPLSVTLIVFQGHSDIKQF